jgi:hypothetical protein
MACAKDHAGDLPKAAFDKLGDSQAGFWRHKCAGFAFELGRQASAEAETRLRDRVRELQAEVTKLRAGK